MLARVHQKIRSVFVSPFHEWVVVSFLLLSVIGISISLTRALFVSSLHDTVLGTSTQMNTNSSKQQTVYFGVATGSANMMIPLWDEFESQLNKKVSIFHEYQGLDTDTCRWVVFPQHDLGTSIIGVETIRQRGAIPMLTYMTDTLTTVNNGVYDDCLIKIAQGAKQWGKPFFLELDHEMNHGFVYGPPLNTAEEFVQMWRHVHDLFLAEGVTNATWVWCPSVETNSKGKYVKNLNIHPYYPGDAYVDWTCMDGYNWNSINALHWQTFSQVFRYTYNDLIKNVAPTKPIMIGEYSSAEYPRDPAKKAHWLLSAHTAEIKKFPAIKALVLWNSIDAKVSDDRVQSTSVSLSAMKKALENSLFATNTFASIECPSSCPIQPLSADGLLSPSPSPSMTPPPSSSHAPTAVVFYTPVSGIKQIGGTMKVNVGDKTTFFMGASDFDSDLKDVYLLATNTDGSDASSWGCTTPLPISSKWCVLTSKLSLPQQTSLVGNHADFFGAFVTTKPGTYAIAANAFDSTGKKCSGDPTYKGKYPVFGYEYCGEKSAMLVEAE